MVNHELENYKDLAHGCFCRICVTEDIFELYQQYLNINHLLQKIIQERRREIESRRDSDDLG